jgi:hypothetical protein
MGRNTRPPTHGPSVVSATCTEYRLRLGWPVRVDEHEQCVQLLTGEALGGGSRIGGQVIVVDMPAELGSRVSSVLWMRNLPAVVFAVKRQLYVHPYRHTRWCFLAIADTPTRFDGRADASIPLLDVQVVTNMVVPLPLLDRADHAATPDHRLGTDVIPALSWVQPPRIDAEGRVLPRSTTVLAAIRDVVAKDQQRSPRTNRA